MTGTTDDSSGSLDFIDYALVTVPDVVFKLHELRTELHTATALGTDPTSARLQHFQAALQAG